MEKWLVERIGLKSLPVSEEDLERRDELSQGNRSIALQPGLVLLNILNKDEKVLAGALVVDLGLCALASSHFEKRNLKLRSFCEDAGYRVTCVSKLKSYELKGVAVVWYFLLSSLCLIGEIKSSNV